jgi:rhamnogalacturonyl hydrolase YesR
MRNGDNLWNDGLTSACTNNGQVSMPMSCLIRKLNTGSQTTWIYNQGVIASGLAALYVARGSTDTSLLDEAEKTLDATIAKLTVNNILKESCDDAVSSSCNHDQV